MTATDRLWGSISIGEIQFEDRLEMAPMTRSRSTPGIYTDYPTLTTRITAGDRVA